MKKIIYFLILVISIVSCSSDIDDTEITNDNSEIESPNLIGKWDLVSSCGGITGICWYPTEDNKELIEFKDNLTYIEKINDIVEVESTYIITDTLVIDNNEVFIIEFGFEYTTEFTFKNDTLSVEGGDYWKNYIRNE
jgi:hypothetical protein